MPGVHFVSEQSQQRRQEGERSEDRHRDDEYCPQRHSQEDGRRDYQHARKCDHDDHAREEHGAICRGAGPCNGLFYREALASFLLETRHDEQRVVDADGQPDHRDEVGHEKRDVLVELAYQRNGAGGDDDSHGSQDYRYPGGTHRPEHQQQDDDGDPHPNRLALDQVSLGDIPQVLINGGFAGHGDVESVGRVGLSDFKDSLDFAAGRQRDRDDGPGHVRRSESRRNLRRQQVPVEDRMRVVQDRVFAGSRS